MAESDNHPPITGHLKINLSEMSMSDRVRDKLFESADTNKDDVLSREEFATVVGGAGLDACPHTNVETVSTNPHLVKMCRDCGETFRGKHPWQT